MVDSVQDARGGRGLVIMVKSQALFNSLMLSVSKSGSGNGTVTSDPPGILCGSDCVESYDEPQTVTLTATPYPGSTFEGWTGCDSMDDDICSIYITETKIVTAAFADCPADYNDDGKVDGLDFIIFRNEWGRTDCLSVGCEGDMNSDGKVDGLDFIIFRNDWGKVCP